jgi:uncharacterized protein with von Willebrand factor type A (vWA) domain
VIDALQRFVGQLREAGIAVSPAEWIEALRAAELVGIEDRALFRAALKATLIKRAGQRQAFDETFDRFFAGPRLGRGRGTRGLRGAAGERPRVGAPDRPGEKPPIKPKPEESEQRETKRREPRTLRQAIEQVREGQRQRHGRLRHVVLERKAERREPALRREVERIPLRDLARRRIAEPESLALARAVRREVERLRLGTARRVRRAPSGRPYLRRMFRESLRTAGVPFVLPRARRRTDTPRVVLLIDVSWSTARAAGLFLTLASEFLRFGRQTRVLLFVDRTVDVTEPVARWIETRSRAPFDGLLGQVRGLNLNAPSDYGRAFHHLLRSPARPHGRRTVLVVLGDGRTNRFDPLAWAFAELANECGAAIWLVPEAVAMWGAGDSALDRYLPHVDTAVEARDLSGLARGVREIVRRVR